MKRGKEIEKVEIEERTHNLEKKKKSRNTKREIK